MHHPVRAPLSFLPYFVSPHLLSNSSRHEGVVIFLRCKILLCCHVYALSGSSSSPPSLIGSIIYQCHKAVLVPKFHMPLYVCVDVLWVMYVLCYGYCGGRKHKGLFIFSDLCTENMEWSGWISNAYPTWSEYHAIMLCRVATLEKCLGVRSMEIRQIL